MRPSAGVGRGGWLKVGTGQKSIPTRPVHDVVRRHAACGTPQEVRARLDEYRAIGLDEVVLGGLDDAASIAATLKAING